MTPATRQPSLFRAQSVALQLATLPPSTNNAYMNIKGRGRVLTEAARSWKDDATQTLTATLARSGWEVAPGTLWSATVQLSTPHLYRWDLDGRLKLLLDAVAAAIGTDDRYLLDLTIGKRKASTEGVQIWVVTMPSDQDLADWSRE